MLKENVDYELIPSDDPEDDAWSVRILKGDFVETVFQYGAIKLNGEDLDDDEFVWLEAIAHQCGHCWRRDGQSMIQ